MQFDTLVKSLGALADRFHCPGELAFTGVPAFLGVRAGQRLNHVTVHARRFFYFSKDQPPAKWVQHGMAAIGSPLDDAGMVCQTRGGWLNANPAVILAVPAEPDETGGFQVIAFAREGWISQNTVVRVLDRFEGALTRQGAQYESEILIPMTRLDLMALAGDTAG